MPYFAIYGRISPSELEQRQRSKICWVYVFGYLYMSLMHLRLFNTILSLPEHKKAATFCRKILPLFRALVKFCSTNRQFCLCQFDFTGYNFTNKVIPGTWEAFKKWKHMHSAVHAKKDNCVSYKGALHIPICEKLEHVPPSFPRFLRP